MKTRRRWRWAFAGTLPLAMATPAAGQAPGYTQIDTRQIFAEFHAEVLANLNDLMESWGTAWSTDQAESLTDHYWENAVLILRGVAIRANPPKPATPGSS